MYIVYCTIDFFQIFNAVGLLVQEGYFGDQFTQSGASQSFSLTILIMLMVYYCIGIPICFYGYREFKAMMFDHGMGGGFGMTGVMNRG